MIGHYLLTLTPEQEDRLLTESFWPFNGDEEDEVNNRCMIQCAEGIQNPLRAAEKYHWTPRKPILFRRHKVNGNPADRYDDLCEKFGAERINAAIRNRILANKARRVLPRRWEDAERYMWEGK